MIYMSTNGFLPPSKSSTAIICSLGFDCSLHHPLHEFPRSQLARRLELVEGSGGVRHEEVTQLREGAGPNETNSCRGHNAKKAGFFVLIVAILKTLVKLRQSVTKSVMNEVKPEGIYD